MLTREVATVLGVSPATVRRYESRGLLPRAIRNQFNQYRQWPVDQIEAVLQGKGVVEM